MKYPSYDIAARDLLDTRGAARIIADRQRKDTVSVDTIHLLVRHHNLKAYIFNEDGVLVERPGNEDMTRKRTRSGQALYFVKSDVEQIPLPREQRGKPKKQFSSSSEYSSENT